MFLQTFAFIVLISMATAKQRKVKIHDGPQPGKCNATHRGAFIMVKDRKDNDKLLICAEENKSYVWKTTDGSNPTGEFFNPAYDCSEILNKNPEAKNGFYWIKLSGNAPKKVWCDLTTDGGGFLLIGRTNSSITWTVPSENTPVEPFGEPHWSSTLGDAPILDFRIQVATQEDFSTTRAHWSYRLQNKRPLKNLLMVNEGGCGRVSPGIGDIVYVKDLQTDEIASTTFRCSHFGIFHPKSSKFGWDMMNHCLEQPCPLGFAFFHKLPIRLQTDHSGAFSYSASAKTSGITQNSTSFVGCDNRKCCACFGPPGGRKDYCGPECAAINGGIIVKNVYMWFWVRTSLPKRVWDKCMEYKVTAEGKVVWYKLYNGKGVPVVGRCNQNEAHLNDGIVVVPDGIAAQKIPPIPGLLEYRKDNHKLYVRSNESWNVIGEEKKIINHLHEKFAQLERRLDQLQLNLQSQLKSVDKKVDQIKASAKSCASLYKAGHRHSGVYTVNPDGLGSFQVRCDMITEGGGWTVFQKRQDGSVDFYRKWQDYKNGFGDYNEEFWLGLDRIHRLTKSGQNVLRIDLTDLDNTKRYAKYGTFTVASESDSYKLNIGNFSGNAGDSLIHGYNINGMKFSTKDRDNDGNSSQHCAVMFKGAWWYRYCTQGNLNGQYSTKKLAIPSGFTWYQWPKQWKSMKETEMKVRPTRF